MPRKRMISPEFFTSRTMNALPVTTMVTFEGIWCHADDAGRTEDDEVMVRAAVWPRRRQMTEVKTREAIDQLAAVGVLCKYQVNGYALMHVTAWSEHQRISHPTVSKLPPCPNHEPEAWTIFESGIDSALDKFRDTSRHAPEGFRRDSGSPPEASGGTPPQCSLSKSNLVKSKGPGPGGDATSTSGRLLGLASNG